MDDMRVAGLFDRTDARLPEWDGRDAAIGAIAASIRNT
jgi:hypothetical protein